MTLSQCIYFQAVCKYQNVTLAANALFVSQPTISIAIKELEQEFDVRLFFRKNKQLILTKEGAYLLEQVNKILSIQEEIKVSMRDFSDSHPVLRLGLTPILSIYFFDHFFRPFQEMHPNIQLEISEHMMTNIFNTLRETTLDIVLTFLDNQQDDDFEKLSLLNTPLCFCVSKNHPYANLEKVTFPMLKNEPIAMIRPSSHIGQKINPYFAEHGIKPNIILRSSQYHILRSYILQNYAGGFFPKAVLRNEPDISCIPLEPYINIEIGLAWRKQTTIGNTVSLFTRFIKSVEF